MRTATSHKRDTVEAEPDEGEAPGKAQRIFSICVGHGATDKIGEVKAKEYDEDLKAMVEGYRARNAVGECFVHIRKRHSSNKDLSVLNR